MTEVQKKPWSLWITLVLALLVQYLMHQQDQWRAEARYLRDMNEIKASVWWALRPADNR